MVLGREGCAFCSRTRHAARAPRDRPQDRKLKAEIIVRDSKVLMNRDAFPVKGRHRQTVKTLNVASRGATVAAMKAEKVVENDHGLTVASVVNNRDEKPQ
jgi:hypothetical protein